MRLKPTSIPSFLEVHESGNSYDEISADYEKEKKFQVSHLLNVSTP